MSHEQITKARSRLLLDHPFFGTLALRLKTEITDQVPTGATDGVKLLVNPKWFDKLKPVQQTGFVAHEVMHVALLHMLRRNNRDAHKWNVAADYRINNTLLKEGFILPETELIDDKYDTPKPMSTEEIYSILPDDLGEEKDGFGILLKNHDDPGGCGGVMDHPSISAGQEVSGSVEADFHVAIQQAAEAARSAGKLSGDLESLVADILEPKVDWRGVLARFFRSNTNTDFSWIKPNRRFIAQGLYLPSLYNPALEEIAVIVDTSGSVSDDELTQFTSETTAILHDLNPESIHFIQCDTEVNEYAKYSREDLPLRVTYKGRGGTMFYPAFDYIKEHCPNVKAAVYLTDLESSDFGDEPPFPVLWVTTYAEEAPYGEIIKM